jgi:hypothetical protein
MSAEIVGNQSVYWKMTHHDSANNKKKLKCQVPDATVGGLPGPDTIHVSDQAFGHDDIPFADIGKRHRKPGFFKVTLRFATNADAVAQLTAALNSIGKGTEAVAYVLAVNRASGNVDPAKPPAEIEIDW